MSLRRSASSQREVSEGQLIVGENLDYGNESFPPNCEDRGLLQDCFSLSTLRPSFRILRTGHTLFFFCTKLDGASRSLLKRRLDHVLGSARTRHLRFLSHFIAAVEVFRSNRNGLFVMVSTERFYTLM